MKGLWVDDIRKIPSDYKNWDLATSYDEAIKLLSTNDYDVVSLDHDLASFDKEGNERTGYDIVKWLVQRKLDGYPVPNEYRIHSANPIGRNNMQHMIDRYLKENTNYTRNNAAVLKTLAELGLLPDEDLSPEQEEQLELAIAELKFKEMYK